MKQKLFSEASVIDIYGQFLVEPDRLAYPHTNQEIAAFLEYLKRYKDADAFVGYVDGAYDVPTENHVWALRDCRHRLAQAYFGDTYTKASDAEKRKLVASDKIVLIVTVDANEKVAIRKGFKANKGSIARPVYDWLQRANRVGGFMIPDGKGAYRPVVDLITVDGDPKHKGTPLETHLTLGTYLAKHDILGAWLLYSWHKEWFGQAKNITSKYLVMSEVTYAYDPLTGERSSSTAIINRIRA